MSLTSHSGSALEPSQDRLTTVGTVMKRVDGFLTVARASDPAKQISEVTALSGILDGFREWLVESSKDGEFNIDLREQMRSMCKGLVEDGYMTPMATQQIMNVFEKYGR